MSQPADWEGVDEPKEQEFFHFRLYVTGASTHSVRAIANIKHICETHLPGRYSLNIIDVHQQKQLSEAAQLIALPLLIKETPWPERRFIGDLSDTDKVLKGLGIVS
ncbi:circadian clock KaiB family protein [Larkinella harenae]